MKNNILKFLGLTFFGIPLSTLAAPINHTECKTATTSQVEALFNNWNAALQTRDPKKIAELYVNKAVLLPTLSNTPRTNHQELEDYFAYFVKNSPVGKLNSHVIRSGCNWATDTGLYTFTFDGKNGKETVNARFSYAYEYIDNKWLIVSHHSSLLPNATDYEENKKEMSFLEEDK